MQPGRQDLQDDEPERRDQCSTGIGTVSTQAMVGASCSLLHGTSSTPAQRKKEDAEEQAAEASPAVTLAEWAVEQRRATDG